MGGPISQMCDDLMPPRPQALSRHWRGERTRPGLPQPKPDLADEAQAKRYYDGLEDQA